MRLILFLSLTLIICSFTGNKDNPFNKVLQKKYTYVPTGEVMIDTIKKSVDGFYMMKTEVSNLDYKEFLYHLKIEGETEKLKISEVNNDGWESESFRELYYEHPSYHDYPVVNITKEAATLYCQFLKKMLNQNEGLKGYKVVECRLPSREEWMLAAHAGRLYPLYPWGGYYLMDDKGQLLANFNRIGAPNISYDYESKSYKVIEKPSINTSALMPSQIYSFLPNDYDLYHMSGNVAEMVADKAVAVGGGWNSTGYDIRIESEMPFESYSPEVGFRPLLILEKIK